MRNLRGILLANKIINKTGRTLHMYEDVTGEIEPIEVSDKKLTKMPRVSMWGRDITACYAYTKEDFKKLARSGRELDDIAVLRDDNARGYENTPVDYLVWGKDLKTVVRYRHRLV